MLVCQRVTPIYEKNLEKQNNVTKLLVTNQPRNRFCGLVHPKSICVAPFVEKKTQVDVPPVVSG